MSCVEENELVARLHEAERRLLQLEALLDVEFDSFARPAAVAYLDAALQEIRRARDVTQGGLRGRA